MKLKRCLSAILALLTVLVCIPMSVVSAENENPFADVNENAWYYSAVMRAYTNNYFAGTSGTTFSPDSVMTRAMIVTVVAGVGGVDVSGYTGTSFDDVNEGMWYSHAVEWAFSEGICAPSGRYFGPDEAIERQELASILYNYADYAGYDTSLYETFKYNRGVDIDDIDEANITAFKWAVDRGIIGGTGNEGTQPVFSPCGTVTRAQVAKMICNFVDLVASDNGSEYPAAGFTINGADISEYRIVRSGSASDDTKKASKELRDFILEVTGINLSIVTDAEPKTMYEIIVGKTNREDDGTVTVTRNTDYPDGFSITVQGNYLVIAGNREAAKASKGSLLGVYDFAERILGYTFYNDGVKLIASQNIIELEDGYSYSHEPLFESRSIYSRLSFSNELKNVSSVRSMYMVHNLGELTGTGDWNSSNDNPCLSSGEYLQYAINKVKSDLSRNPGMDMFYVSQNDSKVYCTCDRCMEIYRQEKSRCGTLVRFCNELLDGIKDEYPNVKIKLLAYLWSVKPVQYTTPDENIIIEYCSIYNCASHSYYDENCVLNHDVVSNITGWSDICSKVYVWDYSTNFSYTVTPFPNFECLRQNMNWFAEHGVRGIFSNGTDGISGEFAYLRGYLLSRLAWDPEMDEETYNYYYNDFLSAYYGPAAAGYIRQYLDLTEELSEGNHFGYYAHPSCILNYDDVLANMDKMTALFDAAEAAADTSEQLTHIQRSRLSLTYIIQNATYESLYVNGTAAQRSAYYAENQQFYNDVRNGNIEWGEGKTLGVADYSLPPSMWECAQ